jgi:hypothetical protein
MSGPKTWVGDDENERRRLQVAWTIVWLYAINVHYDLHLRPVTREDWSPGEKEPAPNAILSTQVVLLVSWMCKLRSDMQER